MVLRGKAVRALLLEAAGVRVTQPAAEAEGAEPAASPPRAGAEAAGEREALDGARRRALVVVGLDAAALAVLLVLRQSDRFLVLGRQEETVFTLGVLAVAVHLGFRLAQAATIATVRRLHEDLAGREE